MAPQLGVGVIGVGTIGRQHAENLARRIAGARLVAVADARPETARRVAERAGRARWFTTAEELAAASRRRGRRRRLQPPCPPRRHPRRRPPPQGRPLRETDHDDAGRSRRGDRRRRRRRGPPPDRVHAPLRPGLRRRQAADRGGRDRHAGPLQGDPPQPFAAALLPAASGAAAVSVFVDAAIHDYDNARWLLGDEVTEVQAATAPVLVPERARRPRPLEPALRPRRARQRRGLPDLRLWLRRPDRDRRHERDDLHRRPARDRLHAGHRRTASPITRSITGWPASATPT